MAEEQTERAEFAMVAGPKSWAAPDIAAEAPADIGAEALAVAPLPTAVGQAAAVELSAAADSSQAEP